MAKKLVVISDSGSAYCVDVEAGTIEKLPEVKSESEESVTRIDPAQAKAFGCEDAVAMIIMAKL